MHIIYGSVCVCSCSLSRWHAYNSLPNITVTNCITHKIMNENGCCCGCCCDPAVDAWIRNICSNNGGRSKNTVIYALHTSLILYFQIDCKLHAPTHTHTRALPSLPFINTISNSIAFQAICFSFCISHNFFSCIPFFMSCNWLGCLLQFIFGLVCLGRL